MPLASESGSWTSKSMQPTKKVKLSEQDDPSAVFLVKILLVLVILLLLPKLVV